MNFIDLSHQINNNMISYTSEEKVYLNSIYSIDDDGFEVCRLNLTTHSGTHVDAPSHMIKNGINIEEINLENFIGKALVLHHTLNTPIPLEILNNINLNNIDFLFFYTGAEILWNDKSFLTDFKVPSRKLIDKICNSNLKGVGIDAISIDSYSSKDFYNHVNLLKNGKVIYECLNNLSLLKDKYFHFYGLPLKITKGDASPVRAFGKL